MPTARTAKSRSGCRQCKVRRIKCDETTPSCTNCIRKNIECPGYATQYKWTAKRHTDPTTFARGPVKWRSLGSDRSRDSPRDTGDIDAASVVGVPQQTLHVDLGNAAAESQECSDPGPSRHVDLDGLQVSQAEAAVSGASSGLCVSSPRYAHPIYGHDAQTTGDRRRQHARRLLSGFYGSNTVAMPLVHHETRLVEYYFSTICRLYSCVDSSYNPFRRSVGQLWTSSAATYYAIQSMAAAYLGNRVPAMMKQGQILHQKAADHLVEEMQMCPPRSVEFDRPLLTLLLLGMSACWQRSSDLGLPYLRTARRLITQSLADEEYGVVVAQTPVVEFFEEAMVYWEMVSAFVADEQRQPGIPDTSPDMDRGDDRVCGSRRIQAHVWTGVCPEAQMLLAEVGRFVRMVKADRMWEVDSHLGSAMKLEERLLSLILPEAESVDPMEDHETEIEHLILLAQVTRHCGFLELYRLFPSILRLRLGLVGADVTASPTYLCRQTRSWLTSYAMRILKSLEEIPARSGVRVHQLLPLFLAACELCGSSALEVDCTHGVGWGDGYLDMQPLLDVQNSRLFVQRRLGQLAVQLPARPIQTMQTLVSEVWDRLDASQIEQASDVFWVDVMVEKGWETLMG